MSRFAGHLPTKHFDQAEWSAMPIWLPYRDGPMAPEGFSRSMDRGTPLVIYIAPFMSKETSFAVRPVVRVKMGRRVMSPERQLLYEWWAQRDREAVNLARKPALSGPSITERPRCLLCGSRGMQSYCGRSNCPSRTNWRV